MSETFKALGILPVRGGSKGVPGKNSRELFGRPLLAWAADALAASSSVSRKICSTDDFQLSEIARTCGLEVPFLRPSNLASDNSLVVQSVKHAIHQLALGGDNFTHVVVVQATSPTVTSADIAQALAMVRDQGFDSVITAHRVPPHFHPAVMFPDSRDGIVSWLLGEEESGRRRQDWTPFFARAGLVYVSRVATVLSDDTLLGGRLGFMEIESERAINIDLESDFSIAEDYFSRHRGEKNY